MSAEVLSLEAARSVVQQHAATVRATATELVELAVAGGRVLAEPLTADHDLPPFRRATRDGYALRAADIMELPTRLKVVSEIRAGAASGRTVAGGEAAEIMTGAPVPEGADAVVMVEHTRRSGDDVEIQRGVAAGENIVPAGAEAHKGDVLAAAGTRIAAAQIGVAAAVGKSKVRVYTRPRVAIVATGDELVPTEASPGPAQIRNSNSHTLAAQVGVVGGDAVQLPIARDEIGELRERIALGLRSDLLLLSGGVSAGKYDLVEQVLQEFGAEFFFTGVAIQPGKPVVFGLARAQEHATYFFGLPGNPISTMVTFELFVRPMIEALAGMRAEKLVFVQARLAKDVKVKPGLTRFLPAVLSGEYARPQVALVPWQGSGDLAALARSNCYLVVLPDREELRAGEMVAVMLR